MKEEKKIPHTEAEKNTQIQKEAKWTMLLFLLGAVWSIGTGMGLSGCSIYFLHMPLWWWLSTPGLFVISMIGLLLLKKFVFVDFDLGEEQEADDHE